ncbi:MAG: hypothetical protein SFU87_10030 [Chitinophagaceae bacterium]|nr:hypothetical protein [Chitinophagaceae bacterium]
MKHPGNTTLFRNEKGYVNRDDNNSSYHIGFGIVEFELVYHDFIAFVTGLRNIKKQKSSEDALYTVQIPFPGVKLKLTSRELDDLLLIVNKASEQ